MNDEGQLGMLGLGRLELHKESSQQKDPGCAGVACAKTQSISLKSFFIALTIASNDLFICVCLFSYCMFVHCLLSPRSLRTEASFILFKVTYPVFSLVPGTW